MAIVTNTIVATMPNERSLSLSLSDDGRFVAYSVYYLRRLEVDEHSDLKVYDALTGITRDISPLLHALSPATIDVTPILSGDGRVLVLANLSREKIDIAVLDLASGEWRAAATSATGEAANGNSFDPSVSRDGRFVAFQSSATNLVADDTNGRDDVFVKDMQTGAIRRVSVDEHGGQFSTGSRAGSISADGKIVLFINGTDVVPVRDTGEPYVPRSVYAKNLDSGALAMVNASSDQVPIRNVDGVDLSGDGRYAVFSTFPDSTTAESAVGVYRKDLLTGSLSLVSTNARFVYQDKAHVSNDGNVVSYVQHAGAEISAYRTVPELYTKNMLTGEVLQISASPASGVKTNALSGDGKHVVYGSSGGFVAPYAFVASEGELALVQMLPDALGESAGSAANEIFLARAGDQLVQGGGGTDTVLYSAGIGSYRVSALNGVVSVTDLTPGRDGSDTLRGVERVRFADNAVLAFDIDGNPGQAYRMYEAVIDRAPDLAGLSYWIHLLDDGHSLREVAFGFSKSAEFRALYGVAPGNADLVQRLYQNILDRPGEAAGLSYWTGLLDRNEVSVPDVLIGFAESAENKLALIGVLDQGLLYTHSTI